MATRLFVLSIVLTLSAGSACRGRMVLTDQAEARRLASSLHVSFVKANEASNRAVMAIADDAAATAAREAGEAADAAAHDLEQLEPLVRSLGYSNELQSIAIFQNRFAEYRDIDRDVLPLAVENTNLKAQRLLFTDEAEAANATSKAVEAAVRGARSGEAQVQALSVKNAMLEIQVVEPRHIAEADDAAMTQMETEMKEAEQRARAALTRLSALLPKGEGDVRAIAESFDRFIAINREVVALSRRNTNVRSLAVSLGRKRVVAAECENALRELESGLASHQFKATR